MGDNAHDSGSKRVSLRERVTRDIRDALLSGEYQPGFTYTVSTVAQRCGVSATPAREALLDLVGEGLIEMIPQRGFRVIRPSVETIVDLANVRRLLEIPATVEAASRVDDRVLAELSQMASAAQRFAQSADLNSYVRADEEFHAAVLSLCGNPMLAELSERLRAKARLHAFPGVLVSGALVASAQDHCALVEAMRQGDVLAVRHVVHQHIGHALTSLMSLEPEMPSPAGVAEPFGHPRT